MIFFGDINEISNGLYDIILILGDFNIRPVQLHNCIEEREICLFIFNCFLQATHFIENKIVEI